MTPVNHPEEIVVGACHHNAAERKDQYYDQVSRFTSPVQCTSIVKTVWHLEERD